MTVHNPESMGIIPEKYQAIYSQGIESNLGNQRILHISGQVGEHPSKQLSLEFRGQLTQALANVETILDAAEMTTADIVKVTYYLTRRDVLDALIDVRSTVWAGIRPAITVVLVAGLVNPAWLVEVDVVAIASA